VRGRTGGGEVVDKVLAMSSGPAEDRVDWERIGAEWHERLEQMTVSGIRHDLELAEFGQVAGFVTSGMAKTALEVLVVVMRDHLEMREKNEPERWARESLGS
jgi:hypothetical protein